MDEVRSYALDWEYGEGGGEMTEPGFIYLDYNASTPVAPEVVTAMLPWMSDRPWNPSSAHAGGRLAHAAVEGARQQIASLIGATSQEIVWTSGSTEANNLAIRGVAASAAPASRVLVAATEHKAVLDTAAALEADGFKVEEIAVDRLGIIDLARLEVALDEDVALVSVMLANNETGVIQPLDRIAKLAHAAGAFVHTDATQAVGRIPVSVVALDVDLASLSAHKFYGPMGAGALYVRRGVRLVPLQHGGGHERGLRSGTVNVPGVVGLGAAAELASARLEIDAHHARELTDLLASELAHRIDVVEIVTGKADRLPNTLNVRLPGVDAEAVMVNAPTVLMSTGAACTSRVPDASHVLQAMGMTQDEAYECLRLSVGRPTSADEVRRAAELIALAVQRVQSLNQAGATA